MRDTCATCQWFEYSERDITQGRCRRHSPMNHINGYVFQEGTIYPEDMARIGTNTLIPYMGTNAPAPILLTGWPKTKPTDWCGDHTAVRNSLVENRRFDKEAKPT